MGEKADKLNAIAGAATKSLNDEKKHQEEESAKAKLTEEAEDKIVSAKKKEAAEIQAKADKVSSEAETKKAAAETMLKKIDNAQCSKHAGCKGLTGYCCPTLNTNKMHLGSTKLDGENLGCCGTAVEMMDGAETIPARNVDSVALLVAALAGSGVTALAFKLSTGKAADGEPYARMIA